MYVCLGFRFVCYTCDVYSPHKNRFWIHTEVVFRLDFLVVPSLAAIFAKISHSQYCCGACSSYIRHVTCLKWMNSVWFFLKSFLLCRKYFMLSILITMAIHHDNAHTACYSFAFKSLYACICVSVKDFTCFFSSSFSPSTLQFHAI